MSQITVLILFSSLNGAINLLAKYLRPFVKIKLYRYRDTFIAQISAMFAVLILPLLYLKTSSLLEIKNIVALVEKKTCKIVDTITKKRKINMKTTNFL